MAGYDGSPTCLSAQPHGPGAIRDLAMHYFGCIPISERADFLNTAKNKKLWDHELYVEIERLAQQKPNMSDRERTETASDRVEERIKSLAVSIEAQYKRIDILRKALAGVKCPGCQGEEKRSAHEGKGPSSGPPCNLVHYVAYSHREWRRSDEYKKGMNIVRAWRKRKLIREMNINNKDDGNDNGSTYTQKPNETQDIGAERSEARKIIAIDHEDIAYAFEEDYNAPEYELERDFNGYVIQWKILKPKKSRKTDQKLTHQTTTSLVNPPRQSYIRPESPKSPRTAIGAEGNSHSDAADSHPDRRPSFTHQRVVSYGTEHSKSWFEATSEQEKYLEPFSERTSDYRFKGQFPDQRLTLQNLLDKYPLKPEPGDVILSRERSADRVRYFHIPHNNMEWVEHAIARYFDEERPKYDGIYRNPQVRTHSHMLLRPEYWRGQQHGGTRTMVHARHMRAICERISTKIWESEDNPNNMVLFMPFLHWEEDRKRDKMARIIEEETERDRERRERREAEIKNRRIAERTHILTGSNGDGSNVFKCDRTPITHPDKVDPVHKQSIEKAWKTNSFGKPNGKHERTFTGLADGLVTGGPIHGERDEDGPNLWYVAKLDCDEHGRIRTANKLGQFLLDAARLYEAMSIYRDQQLVEKYLHHEPPLHPRRTLDQSYYWTLKTTKARDRDQVVYRGTKMDERNIHRFREQRETSHKNKKPTWRLNNRQGSDLSGNGSDPNDSNLGFYRWDGHWEKTDKNGCDHCRGEIRKVSRVVMVDQLWMWILDKQTIITSFPKRYGSNKSDPTGVHKSIRTRIKNARKNQIRSVFDVALIILDECSNTFFDRTKTPDRHPQVIDIFAESIGCLQNKQTVSFQHLWHWTERASKVYNSKSKYEDASHLHVPLLNINPEGKLQREIKDIIDELDIMIHVNNKQKEIIKRFVKNVENIYDPSGKWRDETFSPDGDRDYMRSRSITGEEEQAKNEEEARRIEREKEEFTWFRKQAYELISDVGDRIAELEGLRKSAESTSQGIKDLLDLKQQQASILQAWQSVKQADESVRQGRSIMVFTMVTIIFLPLSFMSSVFGMNNSDIGNTNMTFRDQANYMFPISASVIFVSIVFAFWAYPRTVFWSAYKISETWLLVNTGVYRLWLKATEWKKDITSDEMLKRLEEKVEKMKSDVRKNRRLARDKKQARENKLNGQSKSQQFGDKPVDGRNDCAKSFNLTDGGAQALAINTLRGFNGRPGHRQRSPGDEV